MTNLSLQKDAASQEIAFLRDKVARLEQELRKARQAEAELAQSEDRFRSIVDNSHDGIIIIDDNFSIVYVNSQICRLTGYTSKELTGSPPTLFMSDEAKSLTTERYQRRMRGESVPSRYEFDVLRKDGARRHVEISATVFEHENGRRYNVSQFLDLTEQKRAQAALLESEDRYRLITDQSLTGIYIIRDDKLVYVNRCFAQILGREVGDLLGCDFWEPVHPDDRDMVRSRGLARQRGEADVPSRYEYRVLRPDGSVAWVELLATTISLNGGVAAMGNVVDITKRKYTENALKDSEYRFRCLQEASFGGIAIHNHGLILEANQALSEVTGFGRDELIGMDGLNLISPRWRKLVMAKIRSGYGLAYEVEGMKKDGTIYPLEIRGKTIPYKGLTVRVTEFRDVTERKRTEKALKKSEERFAAAMNASPQWMAVTTKADGRFVEINQAFSNISGFSRQEAVGRTALDLGLWSSAEERDQYIRRLDSQGCLRNAEVLWKLKDGKVHTMLWSADPIDWSGRQCLINALTDITELKQVQEELRKHHDRLEEKVAERTLELRAALSEKEVLLREIHHRVKNNMAVVSSLLSLQANRVRDLGVQVALQESQNRVQAMALIHETLYQSQNLAAVNLQGYVDGLLASLTGVFCAHPGRVDFQVDASGVVLEVSKAVPCGLIINELVTNALKYAFPGGAPGRVSISAQVLPGGMAELVVQDDGVGFPPDLDLKNTNSLGLRLIGLMVEQLHGQWELGNRDGAMVSIQWPLQNGQEGA